MRIWKVKMWITVSSYENYLFIDKTGKANRNKVRLVFWHTYFSMFGRPELTVEYMKLTDMVELSIKDIVSIINTLGKYVIIHLEDNK